MKELAVIRLISDVVVDNEPTVDVDHALEIVGLKLRSAAIADWLCLGLAEHQHFLVAFFEFLLPPAKLIPTSPQGGNRRAKPLPMGGLIVVTLRHLRIDDVETVKTIGALALGMSETAR